MVEPLKLLTTQPMIDAARADEVVGVVSPAYTGDISTKVSSYLCTTFSGKP